MDDKAKEMIGKLLEVSTGLKGIIERQSSIIFKLHKELELHDDRIKDLELRLEDNPDKYQSVSKDNEDYFVQPND